MTLSLSLRPLLCGLALGACRATLPAHADELGVRYGYLQWQPDRGPALALLTPEPEDSGLQGARLGISDNMSSGRFLGQRHELESTIAASEEALLEALAAMLEDDIRLIVLNVPAQTLRRALEISGDQALLFNAGARDVALRLDDCSPYLLHTAPSHAMLTDALAQWLNLRRWRSVFLISGQHEDDQAWAEAFRRSAQKFAVNVVADKAWTFEADMRRNASAELPLFTQGPSTTWWWWPTSATTSATSCPSTPGCRARWSAPRAWPPTPGTRPWRHGARPSCRTASSARPSAP
ncbi:hypothetical protein [Halomonas sp. E19]|uniref:hypothetical protein n=1 Tax=Halomonas sp. E19 TaxID=3397247 RepID=UPI004033E84E